MPLLTTALVSAIVAAIVTVVLDWTLRPYLEIRKERILERARIRQQIKTEVPKFRLALDEKFEAISYAEVANEDVQSIEDPDDIQAFRDLLLDASRLLPGKLEHEAAGLAFDAFILLNLHGPHEESGDKPESVFMQATKVFDEPLWKRTARREHLGRAWQIWHSIP